jgi:small subunit ribosomal protein S6
MQYELMLVVNPTADADGVIARIEKSIKDASATGLKINKLGKKTLAYQIAKHNEGEYVVINFDANGEAIQSVSKRLRLEQEAILRYLIIKAKASKGLPLLEIKDTGEKLIKTSKVTVKTVSSREKSLKVKAQSKTGKVKPKTSKKEKPAKKGKKK